jgi:ABC-type transporter Mla MlaB component
MADVALRIRAPLCRDDLPGLFARVCALLESTAPDLIHCDVSDIASDAVALDALARLQLAAKGYGARIELQGASADLLALIGFAGLESVF